MASTIVGECCTTAMVLPDGALLEQVSGGRLLLAASGEVQSGTSFEHANKRYVPVPLDPSYDALLCDEAAPYGSIRELTEDLAKVVRVHAGLGAEESLVIATFVLSTWVAQFLPRLPCLNLWGPPGSETIVRDLLVLLCRRPVALAEPSLRQLAELPATLFPTIILRQPAESALRRLLDVSGDRNILFGDRFLQLSSPIIVFTTYPLAVTALGMALPQDVTPYRHLSPGEAAEVRLLQPHLLRYRLNCHAQIAQSGFDHPGMAHETRVIARILGSCLEGDEALQNEVVAALRDRDDQEKTDDSQRPEAVVLESLLVLVHELRATAQVREVAEVANGILQARHDAVKLTDKQVGAIVRTGLGLKTERKRAGYQLSLGPAVCAAIHRQAGAHSALSLLEPRTDCEYCSSVLSATPALEADLARSASSQHSHVHPSSAENDTTPEAPPNAN